MRKYNAAALARYEPLKAQQEARRKAAEIQARAVQEAQETERKKEAELNKIIADLTPPDGRLFQALANAAADRGRWAASTGYKQLGLMREPDVRPRQHLAESEFVREVKAGDATACLIHKKLADAQANWMNSIAVRV